MFTECGTKKGFCACLLAVLLSLVWPGLGHWAINARFRRETMIATGINFATSLALMAIIAPVHNRTDLVEVVADRTVFLMIFVALAVLAITRLYTAVEAAWIARPSEGGLRIAAGSLAAVMVLVGVVPLAQAARYVYETDQFLEQTFGGNDDTETAQAGELDGGTTVPGGSTAPGDTTGGTTAPAWDGDRRSNILLLGGDSGADRWSMRTDSMIVVSIDPVTGDAATISIPRNLPYIEFPPGSALDLFFPDGFDEYSGLTNAVYTWADLPANRKYSTGGDDAGAQAIKMAIAQFLGIDIQYYVLVDMAGFVDVVDAIGGIEVYVTKQVPAPENPDPNGEPLPAYYEVGWMHMDGDLALGYARTRKADSDYGRMARQRCVIGAITTAATSPANLALGLPGLLDAFGDAVHTDIPRGELPTLAAMVDKFVANGGLENVRSLQVTEPAIDSSHWKSGAVPAGNPQSSYPQYIRDVVSNVLVPGTIDMIMPDLSNLEVICEPTEGG